jgi:hypothetical protein
VKGELFEEGSCPNGDLDGDAIAGPFPTPPCDQGCDPGGAVIDINNPEAGADDFLKVNVQWRNVDGGLAAPVCVKDENRRIVTFSGDGFILDTDEFSNPNERATVHVIQECLVDPFRPVSRWSFSQCVDDEVVAKLDVECQLAEDKQTVKVKAKGRLLEGSTCLTEDEDGAAEGEIFFPPCPPGGNCTPGTLDVVINNTDEGGDQFELHLSVVNNQQF